MLAVRAGRAFDGERAVPNGALILTDGGRITGIEPASADPPDGWPLVESPGATRADRYPRPPLRRQRHGSAGPASRLRRRRAGRRHRAGAAQAGEDRRDDGGILATAAGRCWNGATGSRPPARAQPAIRRSSLLDRRSPARRATAGPWVARRTAPRSSATLSANGRTAGWTLSRSWPAAAPRPLAPTFLPVSSRLGKTADATPPPALAKIMARTGMTWEGRLAMVGRMHRAGVRLISGADSGISAGKPHGILPEAVIDLVDAGLTPAEALASATSAAARSCGLADRKGRLRVGYDADLLLVDGDPLADVTGCAALPLWSCAAKPLSDPATVRSADRCRVAVRVPWRVSGCAAGEWPARHRRRPQRAGAR
jgi:hypothetical protein